MIVYTFAEYVLIIPLSNAIAIFIFSSELKLIEETGSLNSNL